MSHISEVSCTIITMFRMTNFSLTVNSDHFFGKKSQQSGRSFQSFSLKLFPKKELRRDIYCSIAKMNSTTGSCCRIGIKISFTIRYCIHLSQGFTRITCRQQLMYIWFHCMTSAFANVETVWKDWNAGLDKLHARPRSGALGRGKPLRRSWIFGQSHFTLKKFKDVNNSRKKIYLRHLAGSRMCLCKLMHYSS